MMNCNECEGYECYCTVLNRCIGYLPSSSNFLRDGVSFVHSDGRLDDCPIVPVPPHGDLIGREWLIDIALHLMNTAKNDDIYNGVKWLLQYIINAPIIIPAEEGE